MRWRVVGSRLADFLWPRVCQGCGQDVPRREEGGVCGACWARVPRWEGLSCRVCGVPLPGGGARCWSCRKRQRHFLLARSFALYEEPLKNLLWKLKYGARESLARDVGFQMARVAAGWSWKVPPLVVPVPLHWTRRWRRGFNQSERLAEALCEKTGWVLVPDWLTRTRRTVSQTGLTREQRAANVEQAFAALDWAPGRGATVLLVDDVMTTGATLEACAKTLRTAGARRVLVLTAARQTPRALWKKISHKKKGGEEFVSSPPLLTI